MLSPAGFSNLEGKQNFLYTKSLPRRKNLQIQNDSHLGIKARVGQHCLSQIGEALRSHTKVARVGSKEEERPF